MDAKPQNVGPPDLHDATVLEINARLAAVGEVEVIAQAYEGARYMLAFRGVTSLVANSAAGMFLYGLVRYDLPEGGASYVFVNWDDDDPAKLEVVAQSLEAADAPA